MWLATKAVAGALVLIVGVCTAAVVGAEPSELVTDTIEIGGGPLEITCIGHGTLMMVHDQRTIHIDPWSRLTGYAALPDADLILITHEHGDHLDEDAVAEVRTDSTIVIGTQTVCERLRGCQSMDNGDTLEAAGVQIEAVPAYNIAHLRPSGEPYHPKGRGNGYVLSFNGTRVYVAGDTENTPEMKALEDIDVAFLPMNLPYTMTPEMVADAARALQPAILYPYHYGDSDPQRLVELLADEATIEVRIRPLR
jgi:L-ascorbate metabolism protein UlaG (beta-lactamase superfamily)